jgi:hypothetical protein
MMVLNTEFFQNITKYQSNLKLYIFLLLYGIYVYNITILIIICFSAKLLHFQVIFSCIFLV